jgi:hypothetical protein
MLGRCSCALDRVRLRLLDDADVVAILDKNVVDAFPARTVGPGAVDQNNIPNAMLFCAESALQVNRSKTMPKD